MLSVVTNRVIFLYTHTNTHTDKYVGFGGRESGAAAEDGVNRRRSFGKGEEGFTAALVCMLSANAGLANLRALLRAVSVQLYVVNKIWRWKILCLGQRGIWFKANADLIYVLPHVPLFSC